MNRTLLSCLALALTLALTSAPGLAQVWQEQGEAGDLPGTEQIPQGNGPLTTIRGLIGPDGDADMYCISIPDPAAFSASTCNTTSIDTQLWLFDGQGIGITYDDDDPSGCGLQSTITALACPFPPGSYLLAISSYNYDAVNAAGLLIWDNSPFNVERCPDGPGAPGPIAAWSGDSFADGEYSITLVGVEYCGAATPVEPTTWGRIKDAYR